MKKTLITALFLFIGWIVIAQMPPELNNFLKTKSLIHATVSFKAIDLATNKTIASYNENKSLTPASNIKTITTATALEVLGSRFSFETHLLHDGFIHEGILHGNLYIRGTGDPTLGSEFITKEKDAFLIKWLSDLKSAGIESIAGNLVIMDQAFGYEGVSQKWLWEDIGNYYAPGIFGISVFDNTYRVYLQSAAGDSLPAISYIEPQVDNLQITNNIKISGSATDNAYIFGVPFSDEVRMYGTIPANQSSFVVKGSIPDPGLYLAQYLYKFLQKNGITIGGEATTFRLNPVMPNEEKLISTIYSDNLASISKIINVSSNNHYSEHLYKLLTTNRSINIPAYWEKKGLDSNALIMYDGSGIAPQNAVSAGFLIDLLVYMDKQSKNANAFYQSLPVAGKNGTIVSFLRNTPLAGKARLKSGSISHVQSYSGYVENNGKRYAVALIVNNFTGSRSDLRKEIERLFNGLF